MSALKKLASDTALYGVSTMVGRLLNYLLVPLHTIYFLPADLAIQVQLYAYTGFAIVIYTFGMETAFFRFAKDKKDRQAYYNLVLSAVIMVSLLFSGTLFLFSEQVAAFIQYPENSNLVRMFAIIIATDAIVSIPFARLRLENKAKKFVGIRMANILLNVGLNVFFLVFCGDIHKGTYLSELKPIIDVIYDPLHAPDYIILSNLIANLFFLIFLRKELIDFKFTFNKDLFKPVWVYAFPILLMNAAALINSLFDRAFLQFLLPDGFYPGRTTKDAIGIYGQCFKLSIFMNIAIQAFKYAAEPFFFSKADDKNAPELFALIMKWFIIICVTMWVGISLNVDLLAEIFLKRKIFHEGIPVVPWLLAGFLFLGIYYNLSTWFKLSDKTQYGTYITITGAIVVVALNLILVPQLGYMGCAIAFATSSFTMAALCYYFGQIHYPIPYKLPSALGYIGSGALIIYLTSLVPIPNLWVAVPIHIFIFIVFLASAIWIEKDSLPFLKK